ncbi:MAG: hypothetical protein JWN40_4973 [Phycisphaerales bacterium]|nr:hypothetical protein [Phycisphaerales bacterium]
MADEPSDPSPLNDVVDDYAPRQDALEWATAELAAGRTFEHLTARLITTGWSQSDAAEIVEEARQQTRHYRGAVTREQIVRASNRRYRQAMTGGWFVGFPIVAAAMRLIHSLASLASLRRRPRGPNDFHT